MWRPSVLILFIAASILDAKGDDDRARCHAAYNAATLSCCTTSIIDPIVTPELKECFDKPQVPHSCEVEECVAKKIGYYLTDGTVKKDILSASLEKKIDDPKLLAIVKEKCVDDDIMKHGPPNICIYKKLKFCLYNQFFQYCPDWKTAGECSGVKQLVEECTIKS